MIENTKKIEKPLYRTIQNEYEEKVMMPILEQKKKVLASIRDLHKPIRLEEINDYKNSLVHDEDEDHKRLKQIYDKKGMLNVVMVAEKPKIAELISQVLSQNKHK